MTLNRKTRRSLRPRNKRNRKATLGRVIQYITLQDGSTKKVHHIRKDRSILNLPGTTNI